MNITRTSVLTNRVHRIFVEGLTQEMLDRYRDGAPIQDALSGISPSMREFVMTGITPNEWARETIAPTYFVNGKAGWAWMGVS